MNTSVPPITMPTIPETAPFDIEVASTGQIFHIPPDKSILDVLIDEGLAPMFDCKRGECGICTVEVIEGEIDHRDYVLTKAEREEGNVMQICVSRSKDAKLILDL